MNPHGEIPRSFVGDWQDVANIDGVRIGERGTEMEGYYPGSEGVLGASKCTVGRDAELSSTGATSKRLRPAVRNSCDIIGVALWTVNAVGPSLSDEPGLGQAFVLVAFNDVKQRLVYRSGMVALGVGLKRFVPVFGGR